MLNSGPDNDRECVVVHFLRLPGGELRCRIVDAGSKITWLATSAKALRRLIFASAPQELTWLTPLEPLEDLGDDIK